MSPLTRMRPLLYAKIWLYFWIPLSIAMAIATAMNLFSFDHELSKSLFLGFDAFGRNLLWLNLAASGISLLFGLGAILFSSLISLVLGVTLALLPRGLRFFSQRCLEFLLAFPSLILALSWSAIRGPGWDTLLVSLSLGVFPSFTRLVFVRTREILSEDFVTAAIALGNNPLGIARRHLLPSLLSLCSIKIPNLFAHAILAEATLSFLGIGAPIGRDTWGSLLLQGKEYLLEAPHITISVGIPLFLTVLSLQILSEKKMGQA